MIVSSSNVIAFPRQIRVAPLETPCAPVGDVVEHDGRAYALSALVRTLPDELARRVMDQAPRSAQAFWDILVRLFPQQATQCVSRIEHG